MRKIIHKIKLFNMYLTAYFVVVVLLNCVLSNPVSHYKPLTAEEAERIASWTPESLQQMWEISGQFEGDIILSPEQRNGVKAQKLRWPNRVIPYELSNDFTADQKKIIADALQKEYARTCVTVRPRKGERDYVYVTGNKKGCYSALGRRGGKQILNLQSNGCVHYGTIVHEFLHAAGFLHQQSAPERDNYVTIFLENVEKGKEGNFQKFSAKYVTNFGQKYDYGSIMHYGKYAFSKNKKPTILPKDKNAEIGQIKKLSDLDIVKLNKMYNC